MFNTTQLECLAHEWQNRFVQELAGLGKSITIIQQLMFLVLSMLVSLVLFYLLFDRLIRLIKFTAFWGIWFYGLYNLLQITIIKQLVLWTINHDGYKHNVELQDTQIKQD